MPFSNLPTNNGEELNWFGVGLLLIVAAWGGLVNYLTNVKKGLTRRFDFMELLKQTIASCFAALILCLPALAFNVHLFVVIGLAGIAGHAAGTTVYYVDSYYRKKLKALDDGLVEPPDEVTKK